MDINIRSAVEQDFIKIKKLISQVHINPTGLDWRRFIIAETTNGEFAGCAQLKPHSDGSVELASLAVVTEFRNQRIAARLISNLMAIAPRPLYLTCRDVLQSYYEQHGFRVAPEEELPTYFRRIKKLAGVLGALHVVNNSMLVMICE